MASTFRRRSQALDSSNTPPPDTVSSLSPSSSLSSTSSLLTSSAPLRLQGTKPWTGGVTLTSTGLRDLDNILLGGQPLGTCILIEEDRWTSLASCLCKYWCAEALAQQQTLLTPVDSIESVDICSTLKSSDDMLCNDQYVYCRNKVTSSDVRMLLSSLPKNLTQAAAEQELSNDTAKQEFESYHASRLTEITEEDDGDGVDGVDIPVDNSFETANDDDDDDLKIAWQYRKSVQNERMGHTSSSVTPSSASGRSKQTFCHSYDLRVAAVAADSNTADVVQFQCACKNNDSDFCIYKHSEDCGFTYFRSLVAYLETLLQKNPRKVIRLFFFHSDVSILSVALPLILTYIRSHGMNVVVLVLLQTWTVLECDCLRLLRRSCDVVLQCEGFAARFEPPPAEFAKQFQGFLTLLKSATATSATALGSNNGHFADFTTTKRPTTKRFGLKRDRRKLHIQLLHIPPEDFAQGGSSVGTGGDRSGAGRSGKPENDSASGCLSGPSPIDF